MRLIVAMLLPFVMVGCSSVPAEKVKPIAEDRFLAFQEPGENTGELVVNRDYGFMGGGCYIAVKVDRSVAARIAVGESARFNVSPGNHILGIAIDEQGEFLCNNGRLERELKVRVEKGQSQEFRIVSENKGGFDIRKVEVQAEAEAP
ncbi:3-isopropylmalate dehydratase [Pseudomonas marincola]|uniref:3-isopropylmalate dehydratase n=1 Tax=Pseudomonas marincola TaxID=437900 RepID=A0A653E794_9PSED|nr:3-isopropylmalate dehydratase [Pseudomonas marincola]CAE6911832.1 3-isopropylmalate dehydratase [Pseudomonas marincola]